MKIAEKAQTTLLFSGMEKDTVEKILKCTGAAVCEFEDGEYILKGDDPLHRLGVVLCGNATLEQYESTGERVLLSKMKKDDIFGFRLGGDESETASVLASGKCSILLMDARRIIFGCDNNCDDHRRFYRNLIFLMAAKNHDLTKTLYHVSHHTLRGKIMSYLGEQSRQQKSKEFVIPLDRREMADHLAADRTALSAELSRMKRDGLIDYRKNSFKIL